MLLKKLKKLTVLQVTALLLAAVFAMVLPACDDPGGKVTPEAEPEKNYVSGTDALDWGVSANASVLTLGLTPGNDTTEIYLNWYSDGAPAGKVAQVRFIRGTLTAGKELLNEETGAKVDAAGSTGKTYHKAVVKGLKPGSSYQYAVSSDGENWSDAYDFAVPAATGAFKFAIITDPQLTTSTSSTFNGFVDSTSRYPATTVTTKDGWKETMDIIISKGVSFIASCGDQVDLSSGSETEYDYLFAPDGLRTLPLSPVSGNHDNHLNFNYHYNIPNVQNFEDETVATAKGRNYFYLYNNVLFVVLNTAPYPTSSGSASGDKDVTAAALSTARFKSTIQAAKAANAGKYDWLVVQHHKSTASVANHIADKDIQAYVEAGFEKIMSDEGVDFVIAGHDHVYARSYPLEGKDSGKVSVPDKTKGTNNDHEFNNPGKPIYLTFTTASGLKYYMVSFDKTYVYNDNIVNNTEYPYLGEVTNANGDASTMYGKSDYVAGNKPVSNLAFMQPRIPSYTIVEVNGKTIKFSTYAIATKSGTDSGATQAYSFDANIPYDWVQVTKN